MELTTWYQVLVESFQGLWIGIIVFLPTLLASVFVFVLGLLVASGVGSLIERVLEALKLDNLLEPIEPHLDRAGIKLNSSRFFGQLMFWFILTAFLLASTDILGLGELSGFLRDVLNYIPNIIIAVLIMVAATLVGNFLRGIVHASAQSANLKSANFLASLAWWATTIFGFFAALIELGVAVSLIQTLITGFVAMLAIAGGLAFGLGGKDLAGDVLESLRKQVEHRGRH